MTLNPALAIPNLLATYAEHFDAGRLEEAARLFDRGCVVVGGKELRGTEAITAMWRSFVHIYDDGTPRTRHLVSNPLIELAEDGESAACRSQWTVLQQADTLPLRVIGSGRYHDHFALADGAWHFTRRAYAGVDFWGDTSAHLKTTPDQGNN
ncbi:MAG: nuclear transport factor 2 family protein [Sphingomonadaceae bacterium]|nr:nuclear transport factor 2 family protein [Sphingomonadaceae bacterium]